MNVKLGPKSPKSYSSRSSGTISFFWNYNFFQGGIAFGMDVQEPIMSFLGVALERVLVKAVVDSFG